MAFKFAKEDEIKNSFSEEKWKVLIVDDEEMVHFVTKLALKKFVFENKSIEFFDAHSGNEAIEILEKNPDIDLILLDVVMDDDTDGLKTVKRIREELQNKRVRIILRTGQPGNAPEHEIILNYDIDDYKEKTELTSTKLFTTVVTALRTSKYLKNIEKNKEGLIQIIESSKSIFKLSSLLNFTNGVLKQLGTILNLRQISLYKYNKEDKRNESDSFFATLKNSHFEALSTSGKFKNFDDSHIITPQSLSYLNKAYLNKESFFEDDVYVGYFHSDELNRFIFLYIEGCKNLNEDDKHFLEVFANNISISFENICLIDKNKEKDVMISHQSKLATMGEMIDNIAHQWRQPLSLISTHVSGMKILKEHNNLEDKEFFNHCDSIIETTKFLSHTIEDFRNFFKKDKSENNFKLKTIVDRTQFLLSAKIQKNNISIKTNISDREIFGLENEFIQVLLNIINNAIDALSDTEGEKYIFISDNLENDDLYTIKIKDNAGGIPQNIIGKIFEQYFTTKADRHGTGIGLYMVKHIIENHMNSLLEVENEEFEYQNKKFKGACFTIKMKIDLDEI